MLVAQIKLVDLAGYIESDMTHGYNVRVMNIADDHKPFSHRVPPLLHLDCPVAATAPADERDGRCVHVDVAAYEPMISWF